MQIVLLAVCLLVICAVCRVVTNDTYVAYYPYPAAEKSVPQRVEILAETEGVVSPGEVEIVDGSLRVPLRPQGSGETMLQFRGQDDAPFAYQQLRVGRFGTIYDVATGGFTGDSVVITAIAVFCLAVSAIMFSAFFRARGAAFYSYGTIYAVGFGLFALLTGLMMAYVAVEHLLAPERYTMMTAYTALTGAGSTFVMVTAPLMVAFALAMAVSNVELLRHERFRPQNVLGIGVSALILLGEGLNLLLLTRFLSGSDWEVRLQSTLGNVYSASFSYFECMLIGAVICGVKAARHVPATDADYILILGCRFRKDGTLPPLLRGRVDRALDFWREGGGRATLMPTGGQGADEVMPEAEAMRRYLIESGVPAEAIEAEDESRNTFENMAFCRRKIEARASGAKVVYVTTNYHVFRSGVWAQLASLPAEGLGSRTKWWFWPNAFMRECAGLLKNRLWQEALLLALMIAFFGLLSLAMVG